VPLSTQQVSDPTDNNSALTGFPFKESAERSGARIPIVFIYNVADTVAPSGIPVILKSALARGPCLCKISAVFVRPESPLYANTIPPESVSFNRTRKPFPVPARTEEIEDREETDDEPELVSTFELDTDPPATCPSIFEARGAYAKKEMMIITKKT
jgi:hypothetical protein